MPTGQPNEVAGVGACARLSEPHVAMLQDGSRLRYLVPLALQHAGMLERVYIDWLVRRGSWEDALSRIAEKVDPRLGRKMAERRCDELDSRRVVCNPTLALGLRMRMRRFGDPEDAFIWAAHKTADWVAREGFGNANIAYGFIRNAAPEFYRAARAHGLRTAGDQIIAPLEVQFGEYQKQIRRWPGWSRFENQKINEEYLRFERETWEIIDYISCGSDYVRDGLVSVGVPTEKIAVIPYPLIVNAELLPRTNDRSGPITVGFIGAVGLRKGAPYFLEVARKFDSRHVKFVMVGALDVEREKLHGYEGHVEFTGPVPHSDVEKWLKRFDIFFFPSTCEGSAGAVLEAMASGLPILTTPNSGSSVRHGIEGFIYAYDEIERFADAIRELMDNRELLIRMGDAARIRALENQPTAYEAKVKAFFVNLLQS